MKIIQFSGGKDSLACMHMFRGGADVHAVYIDTGSALPFMREFIEKTAADLGIPLTVISAEKPCHEWQEENGYPAEVVAWDTTPAVRWCSGYEGHPTVPFSTCCATHIWKPMAEFVIASGADTVIRGSRKSDYRRSAPDGFCENGIKYLSPLWDWEETEVFAYLKDAGVELPPQYAEGCDSFDCWCCTAYSETYPARAGYLSRHYPEAFTALNARRAAVVEAVRYGVSRL